jgi:SAM-dependent methyltransferase
MTLETTNQSELHQARQAQLNTSTEYRDSVLASLDPALDFEEAGCPTCALKQPHSLFSKGVGRYCYCPECNHIYLENPLREEKLIEFYANYPTSSSEWHQNESDFYHRIYRKGLDRIRACISNGAILDVGCSSGLFLSIAAQEGFDVFGVEPNRKESASAANNGIRILGSTIRDLTLNARFDAITLWDVLEHVRDPVSYLSTLRSYLQPNGFLFVQVPSSDSLAARIMREACNMFDGIEHLTLFSAHSLDLACHQAGLIPLGKESVISEIHALRNYLSYGRDPYLCKPTFPFAEDFLSADEIESSGLGYKIQALYQAPL